MARGRTKRVEGTLESWNVHKGYGFIALPLGRRSVFAHVRAFEGLAQPPRIGQRFSFEIETLDDGKTRAVNIRLVEGVEPVPRVRSSAGPIVGALVILIFVTEYVLLGILWPMPLWPIAAYAALSFLCFLLYAEDKSKARKGSWRVSESSLQLISLAGGWPGAIIAQQVLRHKTRKRGFQAVFWTTVVLNMAAFAAISVFIARTVPV